MRKAFLVNGNLVSRSISPHAILNNFESFSIITTYPYARSKSGCFGYEDWARSGPVADDFNRRTRPILEVRLDKADKR